jgi:sensor histidine kinase YesM
MKIYNLIFSNKRLDRIGRHFLFWLVIYLYHVIRSSFLFPPGTKFSIMIPIIMLGSFTWGVLINMFISYTVVYYLVPKFFQKKKYLLFVLSILVVLVIAFSILSVLVFFNGSNAKAVGSTLEHPFIFLRGSAIRILGNPPLICALLLSLKTVKNWYLKQVENETLTREKANAELQLLKAQIHPHFLFNTLNNIYSFTLSKSPLAAELVQKLADMLSYMITDCNQTLVPLEKEIQLLEDYIGLEKVRYGDRLDIQMHVNGHYNNKMITPLLMIPFVENCFKHGASMMRGKQWMQLIININEDNLDFNLSNSKPSLPNTIKNKKGIGLLNIHKRLELLYPGKHQLDINATDNTFSVYLKIELQKKASINIAKKLLPIHTQTELESNINF